MDLTEYYMMITATGLNETFIFKFATGVVKNSIQINETISVRQARKNNTSDLTNQSSGNDTLIMI